MSDRRHQTLRLNPAIRDPIAAMLARVFAPRSTLTTREWISRHIIIPPEESPERHGPFVPSHPQRRLFEFMDRPGEREFIGLKSTQAGLTQAALLAIAQRAATAPIHTLYSMNSATDVRNISTRLRRLIRANPSLAHLLPPGSAGEDELQNAVFHLRGMECWFIGSGSRGGFANKTAGIVVLDELDIHAPDPDQPVDTLDRARERLKEITNSKLIAISKPESFTGQTNQNFLTGTREELHLPCPRCARVILPRHADLQFGHCRDLAGAWDYAAILADTWLQCPACLGHIKQSEKSAMLASPLAGYIATNLGTDRWKPYPGRVSIRVSDLTQPGEKNSWGALAAQFAAAQENPSALITYFHGRLASPRQEKKTELKTADLRQLCGPYPRGTCPVEPAHDLADPTLPAAWMAVDKQLAHYRWTKNLFTRRGEQFVVDYGHAELYDELLSIADEPIWINCPPIPTEQLDHLRAEASATQRDFYALLRERHPAHPFVICPYGIIDEGHDTFGVRDFCARTQAAPTGCLFFPAKGGDSRLARSLVDVVTDRFFTTQTAEQSNGAVADAQLITVYTFLDSGMKQEIYLGCIGDFEKIKTGRSHTPRLWLPRDLGSEPEWLQFLDELCQENRGLNPRGHMVWLPPKSCNDAGDTVKLARVFWHGSKHRFAPMVTLTPEGRLERPSP